MRKTLKVVAFGGGPADAFIKAAGITDSTQQTAIKTLVNDLNGYGLWTKMKAIYPMVGGTASSHSYNLKNPAQFQITWSGGITHSSNGVLPNGTNGFGNTNFNPSLNLTTSSAHQSFYFRTNRPISKNSEYGCSGSGSSKFALYPYTWSTGWISDIFDSTTSRIISSAGNSTGYIIGTRSSSSSHKLFRNNTQIASTSNSTTGNIPNANYILFSSVNESNVINGYYDDNQIAFGSLGEGLSDTEAANLYTSIQKFQTTLNRFVGTPIYPSFDSDAQSFMTSASITDSTQQAAVNYLVTDLKSNNLWTKMKAVYPMVGGNATSHSYNLKNPSQFQITWNGGITHSSTGVLFNGTTGYGNTNFNPSSELNISSNFMSQYIRTNNSDTASSMGCFTGVGQAYILNIDGTNVTSRNTSAVISGSTTTRLGLSATVRTSPSINGLFKNSTKIFTGNTEGGTSYPNYNMFIGQFNFLGSPYAGYYSTNQYAFATIGDGLTDTDASNLYTIIQNYQTILSRNI